MVSTRSGRLSAPVKAVVEKTAKRPRTASKLKKAAAKMTSTDPNGPIYFWRESDPEVGYLSQWYYCPFKDPEDPSKTYKTAEHYMMHQKAILFNDPKVGLDILKAGHPRQVKALGRKVKGFNEAVWNAHREDIVKKGNILKFTCAVTEEGFQKGTNAARDLPPIDGSLRAMLLATGDREIVEASPFDAIWGIGFRAGDAEVARESWGLNLLGKALVEVRTMLREEDKDKKDE